MPNRVLRDELLTSERWWSVSAEARTLWVSIFLSADDLGRCPGSEFVCRTKYLAGTASSDRVERMVSELMDVDLIRVYLHDKSRYFFVPRFRQFVRFTRSRYPEPPQEIIDITEKTQCLSTASATLKHPEVKRSEEKRSEENNYTVGLKPDPARRLLEFLNVKTGRHYRPVTANLSLINARLREGASEEELRMVIAKKCREWMPDAKQSLYLRPKTLFNATNFAQYQGELDERPIAQYQGELDERPT